MSRLPLEPGTHRLNLELEIREGGYQVARVKFDDGEILMTVEGTNAEFTLAYLAAGRHLKSQLVGG